MDVLFQAITVTCLGLHYKSITLDKDIDILSAGAFAGYLVILIGGFVGKSIINSVRNTCFPILHNTLLAKYIRDFSSLLKHFLRRLATKFSYGRFTVSSCAFRPNSN